MSGLQHFHHIGEVWGDGTLADHLVQVHHLGTDALTTRSLTEHHNDDHLYFGYALDPPHNWDEPTDEVCDFCLMNMCGLCEEGVCGCSHGAEWPAENPWHALWIFGPGSVGYSGSMAVVAADSPQVIMPGGA